MNNVKPNIIIDFKQPYSNVSTKRDGSFFPLIRGKKEPDIRHKFCCRSELSF